MSLEGTNLSVAETEMNDLVLHVWLWLRPCKVIGVGLKSAKVNEIILNKKYLYKLEIFNLIAKVVVQFIMIRLLCRLL